MGSCWYLEHVTTRARIVLNKGENLMGRHSCCKITIKDYDFVSRVHVKMTVSDAGVLVQSMNTSNGVFINAQKMKDQISRIMVVEGAIISLGVEGDIKDAPRNYPIFVLRKVVTEAEEIVLSSDDDDDTRPLQDSKVGLMIPDLTAVKKDTTDQEENPFSSNLHLPKIPEVKQELVSKTTEEIRNIFGEADEAILGSVMDINPYLYNQLNKQSGNTPSTSAKIHDGDVIELDADADKEMQPPEQVESVDEEYDEQFAISQAVLQGMKAEMAFSDGEEDFLSENIMRGEELMGSPSSQADYDDIIIINESDDDELYNKVADWSNKLLSQRVPGAIEMSQAYPLMQDSGSDQESESRFAMKQPPKSLRIDSSSEDESSDLNLCNADSTTSKHPRLRPCCVRIESIHYVANVSELENRDPDSTTQSNERAGTQKFSSPITSREDNKEAFNENVEAPKKLASERLQNRSKSCYIERPIDIDKILENEDIQKKQGDTRSNQVADCREELVVTLHAPEKPEEIPVKKARGRPRSKAKGKVQAKNPQMGPKSVTQTKPGQDETAKVVETPVKRSARLLNRSRSCYMEPPIDMDESIRTMEDIKEEQSEIRSRKRRKSIENDYNDVFYALKEQAKAQGKKSEGNTSNKTTHSRDEMEGKTADPKDDRKSGKPRKEDTAEAETPVKKGPSPRLLNRGPQNGSRSVTPTKPDQDGPAKVAETPVRNRSARLLNRSRSCYMEQPIDLDESIQTMEDIKEKQSETRPRKRNQSIENDYYDVFFALRELKTQCKKSEGITSKIRINSHEEMEGKPSDHKYERKSVTPRKNNTVETVTPLKKGPSPQLLNRSKSRFMDQPMNTDDSVKIPETEEISAAYSDSAMRAEFAKEVRCNRGPPIIEAPFMTKNRAKFNNKDKQKSTDYQNLKNKQKDDQVNKEKRREALKKLSDKPKDEENSPFSSNVNKRKSCTSVPTVSNTNRGEFLTKGIEGGPPAKTAKMAEKPKEPTPPAKNSIPKRQSTIDTFSAAEDEPAQYPQPHCSRPPERKEAHQARNQRTCNRVNFADMERYRQRAEEAKRMAKLRKHVRFCDEVNIKYIDKVCGASRPVRKSKDTLKICLSTHSERREWTLNGNNLVNDMLYHKRTILTWANQWLKRGSVNAVAQSDVMVPIPSDFIGIQQYRKTFLPLMKLELLTTIERDYKSSKTTLDLKVMDVYCEKECYRIVGRTDVRPIGRFELYTLSSGTELAETFASLLVQKTVGGSVCDMTFEIAMQVSLEKMKSLSQLTARPVVDSLRMELGALSAIHQLHRSPLTRRILMPTEAVKTVQIPQTSQAFTYTGFTKLNRHQEDICLRVYKRVIDNGNPSVTLVQGPPGTGKSILLSNLSLQCLYGRASVMLDRKILICAHSNSAVDHMVKALSKALFAMSRDHFQLLRFGITEKMSESSRQFSIEAQYIKTKTEKLKNLTRENIKTLEKQHCDLKAEIQQLKQMPNLIHKLEEKEKQLLLIRDQLIPSLTQQEEHDIARRCVKGAHIVCTTLSSCVKLANYVDFFDICIIDEATQCTEPWTLLPMRFGIKHLVLVGDTQQLPAVVLSKKAIEFGLGNSMFDRIQKSLVKHLDLDQAGGNHQFVHTKLFKLSMQYRMHPEICRWPNKYFYEDQLVNADLTAKSSPLIPYCVVNLSHTRGTIDTNGNRSISNEEEALFVAQLLTEMDKHMPHKRFSYGLISPYSNQCHALSRVIPPHMNLTPQTVDSYQGLEKDVIIISNARTRGCGFLSNYQRLNVALTRPRRCLIICGNFDDLQSVDLWRQLLDDARQRKVYFDLKRDDVTDLQRSLINKMLVKPIVIADNP